MREQSSSDGILTDSRQIEVYFSFPCLMPLAFSTVPTKLCFMFAFIMLALISVVLLKSTCGDKEEKAKDIRS